MEENKMEENKTVSIIVPIYKTEKYLQKCVNSLTKQTYRDTEIILVDDGSPDNCGKICDELMQCDNRIIVIHKKNGGLSSARNAGLKKASGEYIAFVDSDDYVSEKFIETLVTNIEETKADIAMCSSICIDENGRILSEDYYKQKSYRGKEIVDEFILPLKTAVWNKLFRKSYIGTTSFQEGIIHGEDLVFITMLLKRETVMVTTNYMGYYYVKHPNSITTGKFSKHVFDEVYCKDRSYNNLISIFPQYRKCAQRWKFRARMNVLRKLAINNICIYESNRYEYELWIKDNYPMLRKELSTKDRFEFNLYFKAKFLYKYIFG